MLDALRDYKIVEPFPFPGSLDLAPAPCGKPRQFEIGSEVVITGMLTRWSWTLEDRHGREITRRGWIEEDLPDHMSPAVQVVGMRTYKTGIHRPGRVSSGLFGDDDYEQGSLEVERTHRVVLVAHGVRRRHFPVLTDQVAFNDLWEDEQ